MILPKIICRFRYNISNDNIDNRMYRVMYLEGDIIFTLKKLCLYLDSDMLFRIRYYIRIHILYLVRTDVPNCIRYTTLTVWTDDDAAPFAY